MRRCCLALLALTAASAASCQQPPPAPALSLPKEVRGQVGEFVAVACETLGTSVAWMPLDEGLRLVPTSSLRDSKTTHVLACRPGRYRLRCITCRDGVLSDWATTTVVIEEAASGVASTSRPTWVVVIEETAERTARQGAVLTDADVVSYVREKGWRVRIADRDAKDGRGQVPRDLAPYLARAKGQRLPYLIIADGEGHTLHEGSAPDNARALLATLKKAGG